MNSLLFVDISGFTALSQKLDVESLKNHINDYFAKMLSVIDKWGGGTFIMTIFKSYVDHPCYVQMSLSLLVMHCISSGRSITLVVLWRMMSQRLKTAKAENSRLLAT